MLRLSRRRYSTKKVRVLVSRVPPWSLLPLEILDLILQKLPLLDCFSFHKVCASWRSVFLYRRSLTCPPPCMVLRAYPLHPDTGHLLSLHGGQILELQSPSLKLHQKEQIVGASHGWLVIKYTPNVSITKMESVSYASSMHLLNPVTKERIPLPGFSGSPFQVALSADPRSGDCVLALSGLVNSCKCFRWCRPSDLQWSSFDYNFNVWTDDDFRSVLMFNDSKLYVSGKNEELRIFTFDPQPRKIGSGSLKSMNLVWKLMVQSGQELLLVGVRRSSDRGGGYEFDVFKQVEEPDMWVRVESLGDRVLLFGDNDMCNLQCLTTRDLMGSGFEPNSIYYPSFSKEFLIKFSVADGSSQRIPIPSTFSNGYLAATEWIVPQAWTETITPGSLVHQTSFWTPPRVQYVKINFDAKISKDSATYGIVVRNHLGHVVVCKFGRCSTTDAFCAKGLALLYGMELARLLNLSKVVFECDNEELIAVLNYWKAQPPQNAQGIIISCKGLAAKFDKCSFNYVRMEGNVAAHSLSILAQSDQCPEEGTDVTCLLAPDVISDVISSELSQITSSRVNESEAESDDEHFKVRGRRRIC